MPADKEKLIEQYMSEHNVSRPEAEVMYAIETGEIEGDVIEIDSDDGDTTKD